jgi:hypothetical protein
MNTIKLIIDKIKTWQYRHPVKFIFCLGFIFGFIFGLIF